VIDRVPENDMNWNARLEQVDLDEARPIANATVQAAHDLIAFVTQNLPPTRDDEEGWTGCRLAALFITAAWEATKDSDSPMPPADYAGMIRAHADTVVDLLL
jgi:hypothetical protein